MGWRGCRKGRGPGVGSKWAPREEAVSQRITSTVSRGTLKLQRRTLDIGSCSLEERTSKERRQASAMAAVSQIGPHSNSLQPLGKASRGLEHSHRFEEIPGLVSACNLFFPL